METTLKQLQEQCKIWGVELDHSRLQLLAAYADLLAGYTLANVIGTRDRERIIADHLVDSLSCLSLQDVRWAGDLVDVGTGGGLPGIPLSITCPDLHVTLLEATEKKVRFLEYAQAELGLRNLRVLHSRVEDVGREREHRDAFELAVARALAALPVVLEYCAPLVRSGGAIVAMKGWLPEEELSQGVAASRKLGAEPREVVQVDHYAQLPQKERRLAVFDKLRPTPDEFPRRVGLAKKRPLGA